MARIIETTVYTFDELNDSAKEAAREWYRSTDDGSDDAECVFDDAATIAELFGLDIRQTMKTYADKSVHWEPTIYYSGFYCQGDGARFDGTYRYKPGGLKAVKDYAPKDTDLHEIVKALQDVQQRHFYKLTAMTKQQGQYYHSGCMAVDVSVDDNCVSEATEEEIRDQLRNFADWIYRQLEKDYDYRNADEQVDESILANGYEFTEDGEVV